MAVIILQMKTEILNYELPEELIAQEPVEPRDHSRLMVVHRENKTISHDHFYNLDRHLSDCLIVFNDSRVFPARIEGRTEKGGRVELLLLRKVSENSWIAMVKPAKKFSPGKKFYFQEGIECLVDSYEGKGVRKVSFFEKDGSSVKETRLKEIGLIPLPPYIKRPLENPGRYQTIYSSEEGSVAAPTAGLHFTNELLEKLVSRGNELVFITLHVGTFTFKPIEAEEIEKHEVSEEEYEISSYEAEIINRAIKEKRKVVAVGTTVVRALESAYEDGTIVPGRRKTNLFIYPGYKFKVVDALITNFHLPRTSLLALVYAFGGIELIKKAYETAVKERYRFFSFGDAMLIL